MTKEEIAGVLEQIATLLELKNENPFKIRAYTNAARAIETFGGNVTNFQDEEALSKIPGIGKSIALKIKELATNGSLKYLEELSSEFPSGILELFSLPGLGAKKIKALHDKLQISSIEQLQKRAKPGASLNCPALAKQPSKSFVISLQNAQRTPAHFNLGRSQRKRKRCGLILRRTATRCRSTWLEATGGEKKSYTIWIFWLRQRNPRASQNFSFPTHWWNRLLPKGPPNRACDCDRECSAICEW